MSESIAPFGTFALSPWRAACRDIVKGERPRGLTFSHLRYSILRRAALLGRRGVPVDLTPFEGVNARLYIWDNTTDLNVYRAPDHWDAAERRMLAEALRHHAGQAPFTFVDIGANTGLYSLSLAGIARTLGKALRVLAIEPEPENRRRLMFNIEASSAAAVIEVSDVAVSDRPETVSFVVNTADRGQNRPGEAASSAPEAIRAEPLAEILRRHGIARPDAVKIDIEGGEARVLDSYLAATPAAARPPLLIIEAYPQTRENVVAVMRRHGYAVEPVSEANVVCRLAGGGGA